MAKHCGIYRIKCKANGKEYIGQAVNIEKRWRNHKYSLNRWETDRYSADFISDWHLYGEIQFEIGILELCREEELNRLEAQYIALHRPVYNVVGNRRKSRPFQRRGKPTIIPFVTDSEWTATYLEMRSSRAQLSFEDEINQQERTHRIMAGALREAVAQMHSSASE